MNSGRKPLEGLRIVLTGATGFIGRALLPRLLSAGAEIVGLTRRREQGGLPSHPKLSWKEWELEDSEISDSALRDIDCVCHLAAYIPQDLNDPMEAEPCLRRNSLGTLHLVRASEASGVKHFVNLSAGQVYTHNGSSSETDLAYPTYRATYYLCSKLVGEMYVDHYGRNYGFATTNLRLGSPYGPGLNSGSTIYQFIQNAFASRPIRLTGMGLYCVDLVFVEDVVSVILRVLERRVVGMFNVGSGEATSMKDLAQTIIRLCDADPQSIRYEQGLIDPGFPPLDIDKARRMLGYRPTPLVEGLRSTIHAVSWNEEVRAIVPDLGWQT